MDLSDFSIPSLGPARNLSPLALSKEEGDFIANYVSEDEFIINDVNANPGQTVTYRKEHLLERAGPREHIFFDPSEVHAGIVTCGGLCPGLNDVIRAIVMALWYHYGVRKITGIRFGYNGLLPEAQFKPIELNPDVVTDIHRFGGTILGSSRGGGNRVADSSGAEGCPPIVLLISSIRLRN